MITGKQRSYLSKLGQELDPVVFIGKNDVTETVIKELDKNLTAQELVKVKIQEGSILEAKPVATELAEMLDAEFVQAIGRKFVLYRQAPEKENRRIVLPK